MIMENHRDSHGREKIILLRFLFVGVLTPIPCSFLFVWMCKTIRRVYNDKPIVCWVTERDEKPKN